MSDRKAFVDAIRRDPTDDTVRLVYADWLEEHDNGIHAAFIRAQIAGDHHEAVRLTNRHGNRAAGWGLLSVRPLGGPVRGFFSECRVTQETLADFGQWLFDSYPLLAAYVPCFPEKCQEFRERWPGVGFHVEPTPELGRANPEAWSAARISTFMTATVNTLASAIGHISVIPWGGFVTSNPGGLHVPDLTRRRD